MSKLVVFGESFVNFLVDSTLNGKIGQVILRQSDGGFEINVLCENIINVQGLLHQKNFILWEKIGDVVIKDCMLLIKLLKGIKGNITLEIIKNKLLITSDDKEIEYGIAVEEFVENNPREKVPIQFDGGFVCDKTIFKEIKQKADLLSVGKCSIAIKANVMRMTVEELEKFTVKVQVPYKDCEAEYGVWLMEISEYLEDKVTVALDNEFPICITSKSDIMAIRYIISPIVKVEQTGQTIPATTEKTVTK